ncbi:hypothetical protein QR680_013431 [Steinernema hermaphroditum]|uniref:Uncharacterized protein n=1 Tax=Steinernema hermaphroditum TaxID=289476 RepID=A0AA39M296_9BILA|nr:hypothetical protein QR680_013431 [Steinernema hermaphroditum]
MLSPDFLSTLDTTIADQETTIRVLELCLAELKENLESEAENRSQTEKKKKRKVTRISRSAQCTPARMKAFSSQTISPRLEYSKTLTVHISPETNGSNGHMDLSFDLLQYPQNFDLRTRLPVFEGIQKGAIPSVPSMERAYDSAPTINPDIWRNSNDSLENSAKSLFSSSNSPVLDYTRKPKSNGTFAEKLKRSGSAETLSTNDFPSLVSSNGNGVAKPESNVDVALLSAMRLSRPQRPVTPSISSRSSSPTPSQYSSEPPSHRKKRLIITNYSKEQSPTERKRYVQQFCKAIGISPSRARDVELVPLNENADAYALKITFDSVETANAIMKMYYDSTPHPHYPLPTPQSRIYYDLTADERYKVKELQYEANFKNSSLPPGEPCYYVCAYDMALKRKGGLKKQEFSSYTSPKSRTIDCAEDRGPTPNCLFHSFSSILESPLGGRLEVGLEVLVSLLRKVDSKKLEQIRSNCSFVVEVGTLVRIGMCAAMPKEAFSYLVTKRKGVVFFFDENCEVKATKGNTVNKFALLDDDEDSDEEPVDGVRDSKMIILNETAVGDGEDKKTIVVASVVRKIGEELQLVKPDYGAYNDISWWLEARLSNRISKIFVESAQTTESMGGNSRGAQCLGFIDRVLTEVLEAIGTSEELHFRLEKKEKDRFIRFAVVDPNSGFSALLKRF